MNEALFTSDVSEWATPLTLFRLLDREFDFTLDPCSTDENTKCERHYTKADDGLARCWQGERVFMNPPYGKIITLEWMKKAYKEAQKGAVVVCLVASRTDNEWWHTYAMKAHEVRFLKGRVKFIGGKSGAPFPSAIVIFRQGEATPTFKSWVLKPSERR